MRAGSIYLYSHDLHRVQVSGVDRVVFHESFVAGGSSVDGDIALVRLATSLNITDSVRPACLHPSAATDAQPGNGRYGVCVVTGWAPSRAPSSCTSHIILCLYFGFINISDFHEKR